jgi:glycerophosphoryl diester phosphodiesterase
MSIFKNPLVWAHRGASGSAPENTLAAFKMAAEMGADGVELDIQKTRDGVIVVCHDEKVDRTSNGSGWIKDFSFDEIRKLDFCNGNQEYEGIRIPTMEEVLDLLADTGLTINIELKTGIIFYEKIASYSPHLCIFGYHLCPRRSALPEYDGFQVAGV